jgi:hypothetical protein
MGACFERQGMVSREAISGRRLTGREQGTYVCEVQMHETTSTQSIVDQLDVGEAQAW